MQDMQEMRVQFLGQEDPLEKEMATHSSILAWRILMDRGAWRATVYGATKSNWGTEHVLNRLDVLFPLRKEGMVST